MFLFLVHCFLIQTGRAGGYYKSIASSQLKLNIKSETLLTRVLFSNQSISLLYNELEIFNTALSFASCSIGNFLFIVQQARACILKQNTHNSL